MSNYISMNKIEEELLSPEKFLNLNEKEKMNIISSRIIPPKLGDKGYGKIKVIYRNPIYRAK